MRVSQWQGQSPRLRTTGVLKSRTAIHSELNGKGLLTLFLEARKPTTLRPRKKCLFLQRRCKLEGKYVLKLLLKKQSVRTRFFQLCVKSSGLLLTNSIIHSWAPKKVGNSFSLAERLIDFQQRLHLLLFTMFLSLDVHSLPMI